MAKGKPKTIWKKSPNYTDNTDMREIKGFIIHSTWGGTSGSVSWLTNPESGVSVHYLIDPKGKIYQFVRDRHIAWHAGRFDKGKPPDWMLSKGNNPNNTTLGVECVDNKDPNWDYPRPQWKALVKLVEHLASHYKIPLSHIKMHKQINPSRRSDPVGTFKLTELRRDIRNLRGERKLSVWGKQKLASMRQALLEAKEAGDEDRYNNMKKRIQSMLSRGVDPAYPQNDYRKPKPAPQPVEDDKKDTQPYTDTSEGGKDAEKEVEEVSDMSPPDIETVEITPKEEVIGEVTSGWVENKTSGGEVKLEEKQHALDLLANVNPILRRFIRGGVALILAGGLSGVSLAIQQILLPELQILLSPEVYELLYILVFANLLGALQAWSKWLRESKGVFLPF